MKRRQALDIAMLLLIGVVILQLILGHFIVFPPKCLCDCDANFTVRDFNPIGHAIETTLYEDENGTLHEVTRDLGVVER